MTTPNIEKENILSIECRHVVFMPPPPDRSDDFHLVKEIIHTKSGESIPNVRLMRNYKRPYGVTKPIYRNHEDKKEFEYLNRIQEHTSTETNLVASAARSLENLGFLSNMKFNPNNPRGNLKRLARSPYLYGADILSTAVIKQKYAHTYPDKITPYSIATFDTETDVVHGTKEIIMATACYKTHVYLCIKESAVKGHSMVKEQIHQLFQDKLGEIIARRGLQLEIEIVPNEVDIVLNSFQRMHAWKPDFMAIWNIDFDIPKIVTALQKVGIDPKDVICDPKVPPERRFFEYKQGPSQKVTASGLVTPIKPAARWHSVICPASFYVIDAMCSYKHIRIGTPEETSYSLDNILKRNKIGGKLSWPGVAEGLSGLAWHRKMQKDHPLEYSVYCIYDSLSMLDLDDKTKDLCLSLPMMAGDSDFRNFNSQPRRLVDKLHFFALDRGRMIGTTSDQMSDEHDEKTTELSGWITMLPAHLVADNGLQCIEESPTLRTSIRRDVGDLDVSASYPYGELVFNIGKETTMRELIEIVGVDDTTRRMMGINSSAGATNAVEICTNLFKAPPLHAWLEAFEEELAGEMVSNQEEVMA